jgi:hypothetical protein
MPKNVPTKKAAAPAAAAPATPTTVAAPAAPKEWTDLSIAACMEAIADGSVINPFTKEVIAKNVNGLLDVRRPGAACLPKPQNVKIVGTVGSTFAKWCFDDCTLGAVEVETARARFGMPDFVLPEVDVSSSDVPYAFVTGKYDGEEWGMLVTHDKICRIGKRTERGYVWCFSAVMRKARGDKMCPRSASAASPEEAFKSMMRSFGGKFQYDAPAPAAKPAAAAKAPAKAAPAAKTPPKSAPKKVPAKK